MPRLAFTKFAASMAQAAGLPPPVTVFSNASGAPGDPSTYGQVTQHVFGAFSSDPELSACASIVTRGAMAIGSTIVTAVSDGESAEDVLAALCWIIADIVVGMIKDVVTDLLNVVPVLGAIVNAIIDIAYGAVKSGSGSDQKKAAAFHSACLENLVMPGQAFAGKPSPCDMFLPVNGKLPTIGRYLRAITEPELADIEAVKLIQLCAKANAMPFLWSITGQALTTTYGIEKRDLNSDFQPPTDTKGMITPIVQMAGNAGLHAIAKEITTRGYFRGEWYPWGWPGFMPRPKGVDALLPRYSVSDKERKLFFQMRSAIETQGQRDVGNGGAELWGTYLDLLTKQTGRPIVANGGSHPAADDGKVALNSSAVDFLCSRHESCFREVTSVRDNVWSLLADWNETVDPGKTIDQDNLKKQYGDFQAKLPTAVKSRIALLGPTALQRIAEAKQKAKKLSTQFPHLVLPKPSPHLHFTLSGHALTPASADATPREMTLNDSRGESMGAGVMLAALGLAFLLLRKK